jgi:hypothetical protein
MKVHLRKVQFHQHLRNLLQIELNAALEVALILPADIAK